jgi:hypothetical protein
MVSEPREVAMFQPDPNQWPVGIFHFILPPHFIGGVAPSRHDVALAAYLEKQAAQRAELSGERQNPKMTRPLWGLLSQAARRLAAAGRHPHHGRLEIGRLGNEIK